MSLNANKTKYIVIKPKHKKCDLNGLSISIDKIPLLRIGNDCDEKAAKFLGLYIDEHLTWKHHIAHVNTKVSKILFVIKQVKYITKGQFENIVLCISTFPLFIWVTDVG